MLEFIISLVISAGISYLFLQWRSPLKKEKIVSLIKELTDKEIKVEKLSDLTNVNSERNLAVVNIEEDTQDEKEKEKLAQAKELKELVETIKKDGDLNSKNYGLLNIGLTVGVFLFSLLVSTWVIKKFFGVTQNQG